MDPNRIYKKVIANIELFILLIAAALLIIYSINNLRPDERSFPVLFLFGIIIFISIELILGIINNKKMNMIEEITTGFAKSVENKLEEDKKADIASDSEINETHDEIKDTAIIILILGMIPSFAYLLNLLIGFAIFIFISMIYMNDWEFDKILLRDIIIALMIFIPFTYFVFGGFMGVPVLE